MFKAAIRLDKCCEICNGNTYVEDEGGSYYVCNQCGTVTEMRCGAEVDYEDIGPRKLKSKVMDNSSDEGEINSIQSDRELDDNETDLYTAVNTRNNSEVDDSSSVWSRKSSKSKKVLYKKTVEEVLQDNEKIFQNIFNITMSDFCDNISENEKNNLINYSKNLWVNFIKKEYVLQTENDSIFKARRSTIKFNRSRTNTIDEAEKNCVIKRRRKKRKIKDQMISRKIKQRNVLGLYETAESSSKSKRENYKKFIEEYDEVVRFLKTEPKVNEKLKEEGIEVTSCVIAYQQLISACIALNIDITTDNKNSYEDLIHKIFSSQSLNYQTVHNASFNGEKSQLNGDYFLSLFYQIFNYEKLSCSPLLSCKLINNFRRFNYISSLTENDLKNLKFSNYDRYINLINSFDLNDKFLFKRGERILHYIAVDVLHLTNDFASLAVSIFRSVQQSSIISMIKKNYLLEQICVGVILCALKVFYGLNDLPYLALYSKALKENCIEIHDEEVKNAIALYNNNISQDFVDQMYQQNQSQLMLVKTIIDNSNKDESDLLLVYTHQSKVNYGLQYKTKYISAVYDSVYKDINIGYALKHIDEMESKFEKFSQNKVKEEKKVKVKCSEKFLKKRQKNTKKELNKFFKEEIAFHKENANNKSVEFPQPCDTYVRYLKQASKFFGIEHRASENIVLFFFSKYFKIDYSSLKSLMSFVERNVESLK